MKKFSPKNPITFLVPENTNEIFIDVELLQEFLYASKFGGLSKNFAFRWFSIMGDFIQGFGKKIFVFDVEACEFMKEK